MPATQDGRTLQLATPLAEDYLLIKRLRCHEGLNQLFRIEVEMLHEEATEGLTPTAIDPKDLIGSPMVIFAHQAGGVERYFHGICNHFTQGSRNTLFSKYRAELVPKVWLLTQVSQSRIFQHKTVPDILKEVLKGFEFDAEIQGDFKPRNYCVQYRESDWDFASRLMEEEGIYYYFEHTENNHRLILANTPASHRPCPTRPKVPFELDRSELTNDWISAIHSWRVDNKMRTGKFETRDFNFQLPENSLEAKDMSLFDIGKNKELEHYEWPGGYAKRVDAIDSGGGENASALNTVFQDRERTVQIRQEEIDVAYKTIYGTSDCCALTAGYRFELEYHPHSENNINHVLVNVQHEAVQSPSYTSGDTVSHAYMVNFACIPHGGGHGPFRPLRKTLKPVVQGSQTAFVVGPPGEQIFTDKYGRVKVQFHWDRNGDMNSASSCWLRVAQIWAGNGWGSMFIPRIGMEVLVTFGEGDPDQPIIAGCVYNARNMPPYALPENKTRSTIKSDSSKGGGGFNEFRLEDKKGSEQIFVHAEKNQDIRVKNDCMETIVHDRHLIVENEQFEFVKKDKHLHVKYNHNEKIDGTMSLKVGVDHHEKVGSNYALDAGTTIHLKAGTSTVIEAGASLTLKVGGSFVNINSGGVFVKGPMVMLNSGGAAGSGAGASPELPKDPKEADTAISGQRIEAKRPAPPPQPPNFAAMAVSIRASRHVTETAVPSSTGNASEGARQRAEAARTAVEQPPPMAENESSSSEAENQSVPGGDVQAYSQPEVDTSGATPYLESSQNGTPFIG